MIAPSQGRAGPKRLAVAVTGHGFGHATRVAEVLRRLLDLVPALELVVSSTAPRRLFERALGGPSRFTYRPQAYEPGTIQKNCFEVDAAATRTAYRQHAATRREALRAETELLGSRKFDGLLSDIPALPLQAAAEVGIPAAGLWNFTWDWILEPIFREECDEDPELEELRSTLRADYSRAGLHLRLPFSPCEKLHPGIEDAPLIGRRSTASREATLAALRVPTNDPRPIVLVAMGGWECRDWRPIEVRGCRDIRFLIVGDIPVQSDATEHRVPAELTKSCLFCDLVAACDVVLSKPGYGIASECIVNRRPLLGVERVGFREAPELQRDLRRLGHLEEISLEEFFAGRWWEPLRRILEARHAWTDPPEDGALWSAKRLIRYFGL